jgi:hypothetical protein
MYIQPPNYVAGCSKASCGVREIKILSLLPGGMYDQNFTGDVIDVKLSLTSGASTDGGQRK